MSSVSAKLRRLVGAVPGSRATLSLFRDRLFANLSRRARFVRHYRDNYWRGSESRSGRGSSLDQTRIVREELPRLCTELGVTSLLDVPCGDVYWIQHVNLPGLRYIGADIVPQVVADNRTRFAGTGREFIAFDLVCAPPPRVDLIFCGDLLVHLPFRDALRALENCRKSGATWLLTTSFTERISNADLIGDWRPVNLSLEPFNLPQPARLILEGCTEEGGAYRDKSLALWRLADLPPFRL